MTTSTATQSHPDDTSSPQVPALTMNSYRFLGKGCSLRVSPLGLGTMSFSLGNDKWGKGWLSPEQSDEVFKMYTEAGGNMVDSANYYQGGDSEICLGKLMKKYNNRDELVISSKFSLQMGKGPNSVGNSRKNMLQSVKDSLKRLDTDHLDIYYLHFYDFTLNNNPDEFLRTCDNLVRSGMVSYVAVSDIPAWVFAKWYTRCELKNFEVISAYQGRYHLLDRSVERDILPCLDNFGAGFVGFGALGQGLLTGQYRKGFSVDNLSERQKGHLASGWLKVPSESDLDQIEKIYNIAEKKGVSLAALCTNWTITQPGVSSMLLSGKPHQFKASMESLNFTITDEERKQLDAITKETPKEIGFPHNWGGTHWSNSPFLNHKDHILVGANPLFKD